MKLRYTSRARNDLIIAFEWYEKQRRGLGFKFLDCVEAVIETIQQMPNYMPTTTIILDVP